ncbi:MULTISPECIES: tail completion protein gp17 [Bacillus]|jgi:hypothetical protein|uniref:DUF3168 domain-containing protein n=1 Tax=Bacillus amyloliquefaciens (strain ATCC 23350 / DSM 7 / BCRC 11601 / CCUG 28519 / NBRC 15535 / NRRL B-14393 / F) TaxID=692420 RepID=A0A9P1JJ59_BACAS|nr:MULTISPECIES: DUF3168 domain-containing protein [Bacillus amyloliquefaciens group]AIW34897.1 hypothetical protein KS08_15135 [Bacillus subtilis]AEB25224.1 hypothetical protein BAMTA208_15335 [Bacillus amyloliquefaciens TA208]AEK90258.1 hypothetical protein BAXH7_03138 [Bacillus amyloliquefaciens XH7]AZV90375.1 hypothetical protein BUN12_2121 [Bacillus amyloliquefaciens]MDR4376706.1 DUF3168 domain-containing protein [Bacillus amyloliquefaciens]
MKLPIQEVEQSLSNNVELTSLVPDERIYMVYVPEEHQVVENAPMIRINELESYRKDYADDEVQTISVDIQIDLWTKKIEEARVIQSIIDDIMADNDYQQYASAFDRDPDIELYRYARRYRATKYINL